MIATARNAEADYVAAGHVALKRQTRRVRARQVAQPGLTVSPGAGVGRHGRRRVEGFAHKDRISVLRSGERSARIRMTYEAIAAGQGVPRRSSFERVPSWSSTRSMRTLVLRCLLFALLVIPFISAHEPNPMRALKKTLALFVGFNLLYMLALRFLYPHLS